MGLMVIQKKSNSNFSWGHPVHITGSHSNPEAMGGKGGRDRDEKGEGGEAQDVQLFPCYKSFSLSELVAWTYLYLLK